MNLWEETIEKLQKNGYTFDDVIAIYGEDFQITNENFEEISTSINSDRLDNLGSPLPYFFEKNIGVNTITLPKGLYLISYIHSGVLAHSFFGIIMINGYKGDNKFYKIKNLIDSNPMFCVQFNPRTGEIKGNDSISLKHYICRLSLF